MIAAMNAGIATTTHASAPHFLWLTHRPGRRDWAIESPSLPRADLRAIRAALGELQQPGSVVREAEDVRIARGLPGLVLLCAPKDALVLPAPITYPFEPVMLRRGRDDETLKTLLLGEAVTPAGKWSRPGAVFRKYTRYGQYFCAALWALWIIFALPAFLCSAMSAVELLKFLGAGMMVLGATIAFFTRMIVYLMP
jgi:hypothetical protein